MRTRLWLNTRTLTPEPSKKSPRGPPRGPSETPRLWTTADRLPGGVWPPAEPSWTTFGMESARPGAMLL
eukprot:3335267-Pyramimonas_sp.AAC.1